MPAAQENVHRPRRWPMLPQQHRWLFRSTTKRHGRSEWGIFFDPDGDPPTYTWYQTGSPNPLPRVSLPSWCCRWDQFHHAGSQRWAGLKPANHHGSSHHARTGRRAVAGGGHCGCFQGTTSDSDPQRRAGFDRPENPTAAINQLQAFQNQVGAQFSPLDPALAESLIDERKASSMPFLAAWLHTHILRPRPIQRQNAFELFRNASAGLHHEHPPTWWIGK